MNRKLLRVLDEIDKTEAKIAEWQEHLARLHEQRVQLEEKEIVRAVRAMGLTSRELVAVVDGIYAGRLTLAEISGMKNSILVTEGSAAENGNRQDASGGAGILSSMDADGLTGSESSPDMDKAGPESGGIYGAV